MIRLNLPLGPSVNHYWGRRQGAFDYLTKRAKDFRLSVATEFAKQRRQPLTCHLRVKITLHGKDARKFDIDNRVKPLLDAMEHAGVYADDVQVNDLHVTRAEIIRPDGACVVEIWPVF